MTRRSKLWLAGAAVFIFINAVGAWLAAARGEQLHATVHVALLVLTAVGTLVWWRLGARGSQQALPSARQADERLDYLQQSVDAIALEVERIGEAQRFSERLRSARDEISELKKPSEGE